MTHFFYWLNYLTRKQINLNLKNIIISFTNITRSVVFQSYLVQMLKD